MMLNPARRRPSRSFDDVVQHRESELAATVAIAHQGVGAP